MLPDAFDPGDSGVDPRPAPPGSPHPRAPPAHPARETAFTTPIQLLGAIDLELRRARNQTGGAADPDRVRRLAELREDVLGFCGWD